jgi:hypothetical protein
MQYMDNIGTETINREYKVFNFYNVGLELSNEDGILLLENKKWIFNEYTLKNIKSMIKVYLPKYTCAYLSNKLNDDSELFFGIDDFGNVKGIPYNGILDINEIKESFKEIIKSHINITDNINIEDYINIELIKINYENKKILENIHPYYKEYLKIQKEYEIIKNKFNKKKNTWNKLSLRYNQKLTDLANDKDTRNELINYIEYKSPMNPIIKLLKSDIIFNQITFEKIMIHKNDINNIYYWVTEWKDKMLSFIKSIRPRFSYKIPCYVYPTSILMAIDPMIPYWFKFNQNMNLYLIKFIFKAHDKIKLQYKNIYDEWTTCTRLVNKNGPCCQHIGYGIYN